MSSEREQLRQEVLYDAIIEFANMFLVDSQVRRILSSASPTEQHQEAVAVIRSLAEDGLMETGYLGPENEFVAEPLDKTLEIITDKYVEHYDDVGHWMWCAWFKLTDKGWAAATSTPEGRRVAEHERERLESLHGKSSAE